MTTTTRRSNNNNRRTTMRTRGRAASTTATTTTTARSAAAASNSSSGGGRAGGIGNGSSSTGASRGRGSSSCRAAKSQRQQSQPQPQSQSQRKKKPQPQSQQPKPQPAKSPKKQIKSQQQQPMPPPRRHRVLIVGAGISGLAAARELLYRRYDVLVLEGRTRPGGRLRTVPMRLPKDRNGSRGDKEGDNDEDGRDGNNGGNGGDGREKKAAEEDDDANGNNGNRKRSGSTGSGSVGTSMGMASRLMAAVGSLGSFVTTSAAPAANAGSTSSAADESKEEEKKKKMDGSGTTTATPPPTERRQTRGTLKQDEEDQRRSTRSQTMATPVKPPGRYDGFDTGTGTSTASKGKKKRKRPSIASSAAGGGGASGAEGDAAPPPIHPLDQRYSTRLFAQENARTDIDYELIPVDLGGAFIHGTGYETDVKTGKASRLDWSSSGDGKKGGGGKGKGNKSNAKAKNSKADINPLYQLVRSMGMSTLPLDGCTLMDANGNNVDDVKSTDGDGGGDGDGDGGSGSLDEFVQSKFNEILDDCHDVISQLKKLERAQRRGDDTQDTPKKKRRLANGGGGISKKQSSSAPTSAEVSVKLPDGTMATPSTDFATLFNSIASSKSIFMSGKSTLPADLFSWHLNNLEMSCGAPFPALGLKWNDDERCNFGGDHVVLSDGWGRVIENLAEGSVASASAGEGNGPVNIRYGCEVEGIRIVPPKNYEGDLVDDVDDQGDDLSDYEALESDDDSEDEDDESMEEEVVTAAAKKPAAKARPAPKAKPSPVPAKTPVVSRAKVSTPPPARARSDAGDDTVKTRSRSKPQIRRSSRSNIGQHSEGSAARYSPTFDSDLKKFSPINSTPTKSKKKESATPKGQSSKKKAAAAEPMVLSPDSSRHPDIHNSTVQVRTKLADGTVQIYEADHVIVTCPLGVLQVPCGEPGHVIFHPPLPRYKRESISKIGFGHYNKIALAFPYRFWDELPGDDFWGVAASPKDRLGGSILAVDLGKAHSKSGGDGAKDVPVMLMIFGGSYAKKMESMTDEELVGDAMEVVRNAWEGKVKERSGDTSVPDPVDFAVTRWGQDRFARGSFSYVKPGADGFVEALKLARPVFDPYGSVVSSASKNVKSKGRGQRLKKDGPAEAKRPMILFAGEHTSSVYPSTIHGAFLSGIREATRLDLALEPAMNSYYEFDNKTVYGRTFDLNWRSRTYGGFNTIGAVTAKKKRKRMTNASSSSEPTDTSRLMLEDAAILRGCDVHGTSVDAVARVSELHFPIPAAHAVSGKRMTGKAISRRYNELTANGCTATRSPPDEKSWLVEEDQVFISGDGMGLEEELYFDWSAAAEIEQEHDEEEEED